MISHKHMEMLFSKELTRFDCLFGMYLLVLRSYKRFFTWIIVILYVYFKKYKLSFSLHFKIQIIISLHLHYNVFMIKRRKLYKTFKMAEVKYIEGMVSTCIRFQSFVVRFNFDFFDEMTDNNIYCVLFCHQAH